MSGEEYVSPLSNRYAPRKIREHFSDTKRFRIWRALWVALAESQKELGLPVTEQQIDEMRKFQNDINLSRARELEKKTRHDVMAHILAFGEQAANARPIIHMGATSAFVTDNSDMVIIKEAVEIIESQICGVISALKEFALKYKNVVTLGYTHLQPAQPVTAGKRACLWIQDLLYDIESLSFARKMLRFRGVKGTTGTQASLMMLFDGDEKKVKELDKLVTNKMGFEETVAVTGQTYPRKIDWYLLASLSSIAQSASKFATDVRLLSGFGEMEEPQEKEQVGSSAMPHKKNPMRCERITALSRYVISLADNAAQTAAAQWLERSLDDSANRRLSIPESFLAVSAILNIYISVASGMKLVEKNIEERLAKQLPYLASEGILMASVKAGADRQTVHERLRTLTRSARSSEEFIEAVKKDTIFDSIKGQIESLVSPLYLAGRAASQVSEFISGIVDPVLKKHTVEKDSFEELTV
ncbi:MAG: adenylosuccinate lyase [Planctomycetota bacterium]